MLSLTTLQRRETPISNGGLVSRILQILIICRCNLPMWHFPARWVPMQNPWNA